MEAGIDVVIPDGDGVEIVNNIIYNELCLGIVSENSRQKYLDIIAENEEEYIMVCDLNNFGIV